jgi:hypothetical protein
MTKPSTSNEEQALTAALARIVTRLRGAYDFLPADLEAALGGEIRSFRNRLDEHLSYEDQILFPAMAEVEPAARPLLRRLEDEHRVLRLYARDLLERLQAGSGAEPIARAFLAALLDHRARETRIVTGVLGALDPEGEARLKELLKGREHEHPGDR